MECNDRVSHEGRIRTRPEECIPLSPVGTVGACVSVTVTVALLTFFIDVFLLKERRHVRMADV